MVEGVRKPGGETGVIGVYFNIYRHHPWVLVTICVYQKEESEMIVKERNGLRVCVILGIIAALNICSVGFEKETNLPKKIIG